MPPPPAQRQTTSVPHSLKLFIVQQDPNCQRLVETLKSIPALHPMTSVVDVHVTPYKGITHVPSILINNTRLLSGTSAFEYLRGFEAQRDDPMGATGLGFSFIGDEPAEANMGAWYGSFDPI